MSERKMSALDRRSALGESYTSPAWAIVLGFLTALILAGVLHYAFKDALILKRSIAITPPALMAPIGSTSVPPKPPAK